MFSLECANVVDRRVVGGKAFYLKVLQTLNMRVPGTLVIPRDCPVDERALHSWLANNVEGNNRWKVAVRSSSGQEDSIGVSNAGHYLSLLGEMDISGIEDAIARVKDSGPDMSVVVQPLLDARYAGVAFSCDPLTYERGVISISWKDGLADGLVSGTDAGRFVQIRNGSSEYGAWNGKSEQLEELVQVAKILEGELRNPVDIEWVVDRYDRLWIVQVRPVVLPATDTISIDSIENIERLPAIAKNHSKIRLRKAAIEVGVRMAPATALVCGAAERPAAKRIAPKSNTTAAMSVVLLHPLRVGEQIVREFAPIQGGLAEVFTTGCRRYAIRRYPTVTGVEAAEQGVLASGLQTSWVAVSISQEVWNAHATGIIRQVTSGYIMELAQGHFVPKGVVPTSTVVFSKDGVPVSSTWRDQSTIYHFLDGHVVTETPPKMQLRLDQGFLGEIVDQLRPLFGRYPDAALEFGILEEEGRAIAYVIDVAESDSASIDLDPRFLSSGILSVGRCTGRLKRIGEKTVPGLDVHLHDRPQLAQSSTEDIVVVAPQASIDLLPYVGAPGVVGFIFNQGSILGHLAVVLREKGIPAIAIDDKNAFDALPVGQKVDLDASRVAQSAATLVQAT